MEDEITTQGFFFLGFGYSPIEFEKRKFRQHLKNGGKKDK